MNVVLMTREYPPEVYGGAGVHVEYLARELSRHGSVEVRRFGDDGPDDEPAVRGYRPWERLGNDVLGVLSVDLAMADDLAGASLVHSHTWYANLAGHLAKLLHDVPHVATTHSLEPLRPWKAEQLGAGGYELSRFCERTALEAADLVIAVSGAMRDDVLRCYPAIAPGTVEVVHNGIDAQEYRPDLETDVLERHGIDPNQPSVVFVGRITRQKGLTHLLDAARHVSRDAQLVLCAGAPDTDQLAREVEERVERLSRERGNVTWIQQMLPKGDVIQLLSHATVFCCPSVYEPLGIVNLEAMACETAVVASAIGGIPEVVVDGETGWLVPFTPGADGEPVDPDGFARDLADRIDALVADAPTATRFGATGRRRAIREFGWGRIAEQVLSLYGRLV